MLGYESEHPRLWVRASSTMGRSILDYGSEHPRLWVRASSTMGLSILDYGSEHPRLWVRAPSTMGQSILDYGSEHPPLWVRASSCIEMMGINQAFIGEYALPPTPYGKQRMGLQIESLTLVLTGITGKLNASTN